MRFFGDKFMSMWFILKLCLLISNVNIGDCNILSELKKPNTPVTNETINYFIKFVREKYNYDMIEVDFNFRLENYPAIPPNTYDIQILYSNLNLSDAGHYTCVFYDAYYKTVYIYNRLYDITNAIADEHFPIIENRYPMRDHEVCVKPKTEQYDEMSSGLFAIAYATTLILEKDPSSYTFKMNVNHSDKSIHLREHISEMFQAKELSLFPQSHTMDIEYTLYSLNEIHPMVLHDLETPNELLHFRTINTFISLVRATTDFEMEFIDFTHYPELYPLYNDTKDDVQILFTDGSDEVGHYICIFYDAEDKTVSVYDSQYHRYLSDEQMFIIEKRYPKHKKITYIKTKTKQKDCSSCGPFSIAYSTSLILGHDLRTRKLKTKSKKSKKSTRIFDYSNYMRKHILKMFQSKKLLPFP